MEKAHVIPGLSDIGILLQKQGSIMLLNKVPIKPHLQHSYQLFQEI